MFLSGTSTVLGSSPHGRGLAGSHRGRHTQQDSRDLSQTLQLHTPRGMMILGGSRFEEEWEKQAVAAGT